MNDERKAIDQIRAGLAQLELQRPGLAKSGPATFRDRHRCKAHAAFCAAIETLEEQGWSKRRIAQHMEVDPVTLKDWYDAGDKQRAQIPGWVFSALPRAGHAAFMRVMLGWSDPPPMERTGTDG